MIYSRSTSELKVRVAFYTFSWNEQGNTYGMWMHIVFINLVIKTLNYLQLEEMNMHFLKVDNMLQITYKTHWHYYISKAVRYLCYV